MIKLNSSKLKRFIKNFRGVLFGILSLFLFQVMSAFPVIAEAFYFNFVFRMIRYVWDYSFGLFPIPGVYILFVFLMWILLRRIRRSSQSTIRQKLLRFINFIGFVVGIFYWMWGFNYARVTTQDRLNLKVTKPQTEWLFDTWHALESSSILDRQKFISVEDSVSNKFVPDNLEVQIRASLVDVFSTLELPTFGRVRVRDLYPKGTLLLSSTAGIYIPFVSEGHIDPGLHPISWPFTMAHEMSHGYGVTSEGECNFLAYLICKNSSDAFIRYSGEISFLRYILVSARGADKEKYIELRKQMNPIIQKDLIAIHDASSRYPDIMPRLRNLIYDNFLKSQGIKEGMVSYSKIVQLMHGLENNKELSSLFNKVD